MLNVEVYVSTQSYLKAESTLVCGVEYYTYIIRGKTITTIPENITWEYPVICISRCRFLAWQEQVWSSVKYEIDCSTL